MATELTGMVCVICLAAVTHVDGEYLCDCFTITWQEIDAAGGEFPDFWAEEDAPANAENQVDE